MIWNQVIGHQSQIEMFRRAVGRQRLSSAYLFSGEAGIGKKHFAHILAQCLLCSEYAEQQWNACGACSSCRQIQAGHHPDLIQIERVAGKKFLTIDQFVGSAEQRGQDGLCYQIALRPMLGERRIAIINDVELMNQESANSLLKTLEEPPAGAILILISANPQALLPTIRSRCQQVWFSPLSVDELSRLLLQQNLVNSRSEADAIARLSNGSLESAQQLMHPELKKLRTLLHKQLASGHRLNAVDASKQFVAHIEEMSHDAQEQRQNAHCLVSYFAEFLHQAARHLCQNQLQGAGSAELEQYLKTLKLEHSDRLEQLAELTDRVTLASEHLNRSMSIPLCLEALMADISISLRNSERRAALQQ